jgi:ankyrin repeat protein
LTLTAKTVWKQNEGASGGSEEQKRRARIMRLNAFLVGRLFLPASVAPAYASTLARVAMDLASVPSALKRHVFSTPLRRVSVATAGCVILLLAAGLGGLRFVYAEPKAGPDSSGDTSAPAVVTKTVAGNDMNESAGADALLPKNGSVLMTSQPAKSPRFQVRLVARDNDTSPADEMIIGSERTGGKQPAKYRVTREILFDESDVASATIQWMPDGRPEVMVKLSAAAKRRLEQIPATKVRPWLAVIFDGELMGRPAVTSGIPNWLSINGIQSDTEARAIIVALTPSAGLNRPTQKATEASSTTSPEHVARIIRAAHSGDLAGLREMLDADPALLNARMPDGETALHAAVIGGSKDAVDLFLSKGANINDPGYISPLVLAVTHNRKDMVEFLLAKGADVNAPGGGRVGGGPSRPTPLEWAVQYGNKEMIEVLLAHGADINAKSKHGDTALFTAVMNGRRDIGEFLVAKGAKVDVFAAAGLGRVEQVASFLKTQPALVATTGPTGEIPLHTAAINGQNQVIELLLANGADVNAGGKVIMTPLHFAASAGQKDTAELLLAKGADIHAKDGNGWTPLHTAARCGKKELVELLLAKGADTSIKNAYGETPLDVASWTVVEILRAHMSPGDAKVTVPTHESATTSKTVN